MIKYDNNMYFPTEQEMKYYKEKGCIYHELKNTCT